jgi:hypothetical protein
MIVGGIEYDDADAELFPDGSVHDATLTRDTTIQGVPCAGGNSVVYFPSGRLKLCRLSAASTIAGVPCAAAVIVFFYEDGRVLNASLAAEHQIEGRSFPAGTRVTFDEDGTLLEYDERLERDTVLDGLPCAAAVPVWRYANGRLSVVVLSAACEVNGHSYPRGTQLFFEEDGSVINTYMVDLDSGRRYKVRVFGVYEAAVS